MWRYHPSVRLPQWLSGKESACSTEDPGSILLSGRSPGEGNGNPLQYSCLENPMDRGAWQAMICWVAKSWTHTHTLGPKPDCWDGASHLRKKEKAKSPRDKRKLMSPRTESRACTWGSVQEGRRLIPLAHQMPASWSPGGTWKKMKVPWLHPTPAVPEPKRQGLETLHFK